MLHILSLDIFFIGILYIINGNIHHVLLILPVESGVTGKDVILGKLKALLYTVISYVETGSCGLDPFEVLFGDSVLLKTCECLEKAFSTSASDTPGLAVTEIRNVPASSCAISLP